MLYEVITLLMFDGTLVVVSHDRDFLQGLTNKVFEFRDGKVKQHIGDIYEFLEKRRISHLDDLSLRSRITSYNVCYTKLLRC